MHFHFKGEPLDTSRTIGDYNFQKNDIIRLTIEEFLDEDGHGYPYENPLGDDDEPDECKQVIIIFIIIIIIIIIFITYEIMYDDVYYYYGQFSN